MEREPEANERAVADHVRTTAAEDHPDWGAGGRVHNWRNHVGARTRELWPTLPERVRVAIALDADEAASREDWE